MDWLETYRAGDVAKRIVDALQQMDLPPVRFMEVCGTHTVAICRHGIRDLLPESITLTSGPGCPVCVTSTGEIDTFIAAARKPNVIIATFGDLMRVPGSSSTLLQEKSQGADVRMVYSPLDALDLARKHPDKLVVFLSVGFETTTPTVAAAILTAAEENRANFTILTANKLVPPVLDALLSDSEIALSGLICPGHVSIMLGAGAYRPFAAKYKVPMVIAGFEPVDILEAVFRLSRMIQEGRVEVETGYQRAVNEDGNQQAMGIMQKVFKPADTVWRGLGRIANSGQTLRNAYKQFDATDRLSLVAQEVPDPKGCDCGRVLRSVIMPSDCRLFGTACTPEHPIGPCMVSSEGSCGAHYRYRQNP